jgi:diadenosine tetraphosphatase ApaH/serine/threonine PP2A family protein phosphatase
MSEEATATAGAARKRLYAIGDVHGCVEELEALLEAIDPEPGDKLVFLGDYVDRGPSARGVIDRLIRLRDAGRCQTVFLRGNHEDMFLSFLGERGSHGEAFLFNGGRATLASYGVVSGSPRARVPSMIPEPHLQFLRALELMHVDGNYVFVHAGISPLQPLDAQREEDLLWIREEFIRNRHRLGKTVVFGHTPQREVLWHLPYKIGLDTGCVYGNKLSCLDVTARRLLQVERESRSVTEAEVPADLPPLDLA